MGEADLETDREAEKLAAAVVFLERGTSEGMDFYRPAAVVNKIGRSGCRRGVAGHVI